MSMRVVEEISMYNKTKRDQFREAYKHYGLSVDVQINQFELMELLDLADERDQLKAELVEAEKDAEAHEVRANKYSKELAETKTELEQATHNEHLLSVLNGQLKEELVAEQNATQEWRVIAEGMEKQLAEVNERANTNREHVRLCDAAIVKQREELERCEEVRNSWYEKHIESDVALEKAEMELERLRAATPADLITEIDKFSSTDYSDLKAYAEDKNNLLDLIGSLVERRREVKLPSIEDIINCTVIRSYEIDVEATARGVLALLKETNKIIGGEGE